MAMAHAAQGHARRRVDLRRRQQPAGVDRRAHARRTLGARDRGGRQQSQRRSRARARAHRRHQRAHASSARRAAKSAAEYDTALAALLAPHAPDLDRARRLHADPRCRVRRALRRPPAEHPSVPAAEVSRASTRTAACSKRASVGTVRPCTSSRQISTPDRRSFSTGSPSAPPTRRSRWRARVHVGRAHHPAPRRRLVCGRPLEARRRSRHA